jgi:hypothetical protein
MPTPAGAKFFARFFSKKRFLAFYCAPPRGGLGTDAKVT